MHYSSVVRIDPAKDIRDRLPGHLMLPKYTDTWITSHSNPGLIRDMSKGFKDGTLNELKWQVGLRGSLDKAKNKEQKSRPESKDTQIRQLQQSINGSAIG